MFTIGIYYGFNNNGININDVKNVNGYFYEKLKLIEFYRAIEDCKRTIKSEPKTLKVY